MIILSLLLFAIFAPLATVFAAPTSQERALDAFRKLVAAMLPSSLYWVVHEYSVIESDGVTFSGVATDPEFSPPLPTGVPYAPALPGAFAIVPPGTLAYVGFANADPAKPYLVRFVAVTPTKTTIDASQVDIGASASAVVLASATAVATSPAVAASERRVVCYGDPVVVGLATGAIALAPASSCSKVRA